MEGSPGSLVVEQTTIYYFLFFTAEFLTIHLGDRLMCCFIFAGKEAQRWFTNKKKMHYG